jgi:hypothetical protein
LTRTLDNDLAPIKAWADRLDAADADAGRRDITERRLLVHVIRDHVNVINTYIRTADDMRTRGYRPEVVWAAAALADAYSFKHAAVFVRTALSYLGMGTIDEGRARFLDGANRLAIRESW